jgi:hypothetical protein
LAYIADAFPHILMEYLSVCLWVLGAWKSWTSQIPQFFLGDSKDGAVEGAFCHKDDSELQPFDDVFFYLLMMCIKYGELFHID